MNEDDDQHLSLVIRGHLEARANPKEPVDVHALAKSLAAHFKMPADDVAVAIVRHCVELGLPMGFEGRLAAGPAAPPV